jgi:hypothetical protein
MRGLAIFAAQLLAAWAVVSAAQAGAGPVKPPADGTLYGPVNVTAYGAVGDGKTDDCRAFTEALATGHTVFVPKPTVAYYVGCPLTMTASGQQLVCDGRETGLMLFYAAGPQIVIGGSSFQSQSIAVRGCALWSRQPGQPMFFTRWVRGFRLIDVRAIADQLIRLGDASLGPEKPTYIVEFYEGDEFVRTPGAKMHFVNAENFSGQWVADHVFYKGASTPGLSGFRCADNIQQRIDDFQFDQGYWSRDDINLDFTDCRVTNAKIIGLHSEGALTDAVHFEITASTAKSAGSVGFGGVSILGGRYDGARLSVYVKSDRPGTEMALLQIDGIQQTGAHGVHGAVRIEGAAGVVQMVTLTDIRGQISPADAETDWVALIGSDTAPSLADIMVDNLSGGLRNRTPLRSQLYVSGKASVDLRAGFNINQAGAQMRIDDVSGVLIHP